MIERGSEGKLHTSGCSAAHHHRSHHTGVLCLLRSMRCVVPTWVQTLLLAGVFGALTVVVWIAIEWLFGGLA